MPRLVPEIPFPPYSYVTGRYPHPTRDPAGHSYGHEPGAPIALNPSNWSTSREYLYAIDLFNHGYYWESHEAWEGLWHAAGRRGAVADFLKGLIKLAAAGVKMREGRPDGVRRHADRAKELFIAVASSTGEVEYCGLNMNDLLEKSCQVGTTLPDPTKSHAAVTTVFDFQLEPRTTTPQSAAPIGNDF